MKLFAKHLTIRAIFISSLIFIYGCNNSSPSQDSGKPVNQNVDNSDLKVGGVYATKDKEENYSITKVLAIDSFAVHLRMYSNKFTQLPLNLSTDSLDVLIGHSPLDKQGFLVDSPKLIKVKSVKESELEGYKLYLKEMNNAN